MSNKKKGFNKGQIDTIITLHLKGVSSRAICDENKKGQTIGKHLMEIAIVDMEGKPIGLYKIVGKRMIPMIPFTIIPDRKSTRLNSSHVF